MRISVIIPTCNRKEILGRTLNALNKQHYPQDEYEVIIVDDGSTDGTLTHVLQLAPKLHTKIILLQQKQQGPAAARNLAIKEANGEILLFLNDDTVAAPDLLQQHMKLHEKEPDLRNGVLGRVVWSPDIKITPFMYWLEHGGPQFKYDEIRQGEISWRYFWTCNLSLKRYFLIQNGVFDEDFPYAAWEDIELGYRLSKCGLKLLYNEAAVGYHYHNITLESAKEKMLLHGWSATIMDRKVPHEAKPSSLKYPYKQIIRTLDNILLCKPTMFLFWRLSRIAEDRVALGFLFNLVTLHYRIEGQRKAELAFKKRERGDNESRCS